MWLQQWQQRETRWRGEHSCNTRGHTAAAACRTFFESQHAGLESVLEALGAQMQGACSLARFTLAAATVRARLLPTFPMDQPCLVPGAERVRPPYTIASHRRATIRMS